MHTKNTNAQKHTPIQNDQFIFNCIISLNINSTFYLMKYIYDVCYGTLKTLSANVLLEKKPI